MILSTTKTLISLDAETYLIRAGAIAPKLVCIQYGSRDDATRALEARLVSNGDGPQLEDTLTALIEGAADGEHDLVGHNFPYDLAVFANAYPKLVPAIWRALERGAIHDTLVREKLLNLATHGKLDEMNHGPVVDPLEIARALVGGSTKIRYGLANLVADYLGVDRSEAKSGPDSWRLNYHLLDGTPSSQYPPAAKKYALDDATDTIQVYEEQIARADREFTGMNYPDGVPSIGRDKLLEEIYKGIPLETLDTAHVLGGGPFMPLPFDPFVTEPLHVGAMFALQLSSAWGWAIDLEKRAEIERAMALELAPEKIGKLYEAGLLRPAQPPRPYARGVKNADGTPKMTAGVPESLDRKKLVALVEKVCNEHGLPIKKTEPSKTCPDGQTSTDSEVMTEIAHLDPVLSQYAHRQSVLKIVTTELPRINAPRVHPRYDILKETGRTSSYAEKEIPSCNIQNVDPRVRGCFVPTFKNWVLCSTDYSALELCSLAQRCFTLFGRSVMRDTINAGHDPHAFFGAQLAFAKDGHFNTDCAYRLKSLEPFAILEHFLKLAKDPDPKKRELYSHFRKFAKPFNLGLPGGLGVDTFMKFARVTYGVILTRDEAMSLKDFWLSVFPEVRDLFLWVNNQYDERWRLNSQDPDEVRYQYYSPLGMLRRGATYCATANGSALQTPSAEGAKLAVFEVTRACYDPSMGSILYGSRVLAFIHDELILEFPMDGLETARALEVKRIMEAAMSVIFPDVKVTANPCLMWRWHKDAKAVWKDDKLQVWEPEAMAA